MSLGERRLNDEARNEEVRPTVSYSCNLGAMLLVVLKCLELEISFAPQLRMPNKTSCLS